MAPVILDQAFPKSVILELQLDLVAFTLQDSIISHIISHLTETTGRACLEIWSEGPSKCGWHPVLLNR